MFINRTYFFLKPLMPWRLRLAVRRWRAKRNREVFADLWPIDRSAGITPPGWPAWPKNKRFAMVLTHDVEGVKGVPRVEQLMKLELKHGFRSCFNFVPEGEYRVPDAVRDMLRQAGCEVGVHGLAHDGKLYNSKAKFAASAARIRKYLQHWNASGFRSPLMQHKLGWLHALGVDYDGSTFDTDPFEPEPDGAGTIFPFWVPGPNGCGYVELPYTLPQDFTLFVLLRERGIDIWKRKLDWIVECGGMALLNTHPDYMCFGDSKRQKDEYPVSYYEEFLRYVEQKYEGTYWAAGPREVSQFYCDNIPHASRNSRKKVCMLAYTGYGADNRVRRYAEALAKRGDRVDVIALNESTGRLAVEKINGVTLYRIEQRDRPETHRWEYLWRTVRFLLRSSVLMSRLHVRVRYDLVHVHNMPDFLVFAAWFPKSTGAKVILDIHDIMPELFASKFKTPVPNRSVKVLKKIEKLSAAFADHIIVSNDLWHEKMISRSVRREKSSVFLNHVDSEIFYRRSRTRDDGKVIILFPGSFQWHQGVDIAIEAFARVRREVPTAEFQIYGRGPTEADLVSLAKRLGLNGNVKFCKGVSLDQIADVIANADLGVVPKRADSFGNQAYSTKIMEFMSQGVPVVASRTEIDTLYFEEGAVHFFEPGDSDAMANAMLDVINDKDLRQGLVTRGYEYVQRNCWDRKKRDYLALVDSLSTESFSDYCAPIVPTTEPESHTERTSLVLYIQQDDIRSNHDSGSNRR